MTTFMKYEGSDWDRLLAAASTGLQLPVDVAKMAGLSTDSHDKDLRGSRRSELTEADTEIAGILANLGGNSSPVISGPSLSTPSLPDSRSTPLVAAIHPGAKAQPRRRTATKRAPTTSEKPAKPATKSRRKPATTSTIPRSRTKSIKQPLVKEEVTTTVPATEPTYPDINAYSGISLIPTVMPAEVLDSCPPRRCCPPEVSDFLLAILDSPVEPAAELIRAFTQNQSHLCLCYPHLQKFNQLVMSCTFSPRCWNDPDPPLPTWKLDENDSAYLAQRDPSPQPQKLHPDGCASSYYGCVLSGNQPDHAPILNVARDDAFRQQVMREIEEEFDGKKVETHGRWTNNLVHSILKNCKAPSLDEAYLLTGEEAAARVEAGPVDCPIFTQGQQQFQWDPKSRPISEIFRRMEDLDRTVSVQVPSRETHLQTCQEQKLSEIQQRFEEHHDTETDDPWNVLDLRNPLPAAVLPAFLTGENCQLLSRVRDSVLNGATAHRTYADKVQWNEWLNVLDWVLMSEGGHNTAPHTDSHGYSTWITIQEGEFGYGWLSNPTEEEREAWMSHPHECIGGQWRFMVLTPGQTVFFQSGTIHFVFRMKRGQTLALGGHILQWSGIAHWLSVVVAQLRNPDSTNEEMDWTAPRYLGVIKELVLNRIKAGRVNEMGGKEVVDQFLELSKNFEKSLEPPPPAPKPKHKAKATTKPTAQKKRKR